MIIFSIPFQPPERTSEAEDQIEEELAEQEDAESVSEQDGEENENDETEGVETEDSEADDEEVQQILQQDSQLQRAVDVLRGILIFERQSV